MTSQSTRFSAHFALQFKPSNDMLSIFDAGKSLTNITAACERPRSNDSNNIATSPSLPASSTLLHFPFFNWLDFFLRCSSSSLPLLSSSSLLSSESSSSSSSLSISALDLRLPLSFTLWPWTLGCTLPSKVWKSSTLVCSSLARSASVWPPSVLRRYLSNCVDA